MVWLYLEMAKLRYIYFQLYSIESLLRKNNYLHIAQLLKVFVFRLKNKKYRASRPRFSEFSEL